MPDVEAQDGEEEEEEEREREEQQEEQQQEEQQQRTNSLTAEDEDDALLVPPTNLKTARFPRLRNAVHRMAVMVHIATPSTAEVDDDDTQLLMEH